MIFVLSINPKNSFNRQRNTNLWRNTSELHAPIKFIKLLVKIQNLFFGKFLVLAHNFRFYKGRELMKSRGFKFGVGNTSQSVLQHSEKINCVFADKQQPLKLFVSPNPILVKNAIHKFKNIRLGNSLEKHYFRTNFFRGLVKSV